VSIDQFFVDCCAGMDNDAVKRNDDVIVCKYPDGWLILWVNPISGKDLGRWCKVERILRRCLMGIVVTLNTRLK